MLIIIEIFIFNTAIITRHEAIDSKNWPKFEAKLLSASVKLDSGRQSFAPDIKCKVMNGSPEHKGAEYDVSATYGSKRNAEDENILIR